MSHFLQDAIQLSLSLGVVGNKEGGKTSYWFFSFSVQSFKEKVLFIFSSLWNIIRLFWTCCECHGKVGFR